MEYTACHLGVILYNSSRHAPENSVSVVHVELVSWVLLTSILHVREVRRAGLQAELKGSKHTVHGAASAV